MVEVAPMAHFMLGGIAVDVAMQHRRRGAVGAAARRSPGCTARIGSRATRSPKRSSPAASPARRPPRAATIGAHAVGAALAPEWDGLQAFWHPRAVTRDEASIDELKARLQRTMWDNAGPLRTGERLERSARGRRALAAESAGVALAPLEAFALNLQEKVELRIDARRCGVDRAAGDRSGANRAARTCASIIPNRTTSRSRASSSARTMVWTVTARETPAVTA